MSRSKAKCAKIVDLRSNDTAILTKGDLDLIIDGLWLLDGLTERQQEARKIMARYFRKLTRI